MRIPHQNDLRVCLDKSCFVWICKESFVWISHRMLIRVDVKDLSIGERPSLSKDLRGSHEKNPSHSREALLFHWTCDDVITKNSLNVLLIDNNFWHFIAFSVNSCKSTQNNLSELHAITNVYNFVSKILSSIILSRHIRVKVEIVTAFPKGWITSRNGGRATLYWHPSVKLYPLRYEISNKSLK